jgi:hypothetical protein
MTEQHPREIDITALTLAEVEAMIATTEEDLAAMQAKIDSVKAKRVQTGEFADADWYARINAAKRFSGQRHQALLRRAAELRKAARKAGAATFEQAFIAAAREQLSPDAFAAIVAAARPQS